jgi:hypothetical protein
MKNSLKNGIYIHKSLVGAGDRNITTADGNGAELLCPPNFKRPRMNRISPFMQKSCHATVSVREGSKQTTVAPLCAEKKAFFIHFGISRP